MSTDLHFNSLDVIKERVLYRSKKLVEKHKMVPLSMEAIQHTTKEFTSEDTQSNLPGQSKIVRNTANNKGVDTMEPMRRSVSLGSDLVDYEGRTSADGYSIDYEYASSHNTHVESVTELNDKHPRTSLCDENLNTQTSDSLQVCSNMVNHESVFSVGYQQQFDEDACENCESRFSGAYTSDLPNSMIKSNSLPFLDTSFSKLVHESQSSDDLKALERVEDNNIRNVDRSTADDSSDSYNNVGSAKDWIVPGVIESSQEKNVREDYLVSQWDRLANKDFKIKRIEKWVMDLDYTPLSETNGPMNPDHQGKNDKTIVLDSLTTQRIDTKTLLSMDAAKRYISSLSGSSSTAQLANHGLVVIPLLAPFASLRELNLSGNVIVRITMGVLPRGLHILNLSKNNISVIEGLRELTRLRELDLSYNRILRIGHGLASCSLLKELYLAGNKISEIEGLHRLLKLKVLDIRFNKLSTTKSLGQLAANYNSLQAIGLEGNPAQKNVGDEQLKKYLTNLLPHLAYFNRHSIKPGSIKDSVDHAAQLGLFDRGRKSTNGRKSQAVSSHGRHVRLPPSGMKRVTTVRHHHSINKRPTFRPEVVIRRTRSEGVLPTL
ncbi:hypothetical protein L6452_18950 [Arctium lappa]|uniref:Uncharacterized protein n=1 Tax=Arctium lappa TaxID=4217 RepID=A0ACB9B6V8_ARCLA|nr:hypothetical protein L6452_18950 [Arctium lappa]